MDLALFILSLFLLQCKRHNSSFYDGSFHYTLEGRSQATFFSYTFAKNGRTPKFTSCKVVGNECPIAVKLSH